MVCFCKLHLFDLSNGAQGSTLTMTQTSFSTSCKHLWRFYLQFSAVAALLSASFLLIIFVAQETVCQSCVNTALPKRRRWPEAHGRGHGHFFFFLCTDVWVWPSLRCLHVVLGFMHCMKEDERVQLSSGIMTFEAESLGGQVRASVLKSPG